MTGSKTNGLQYKRRIGYLQRRYSNLLILRKGQIYPFLLRVDCSNNFGKMDYYQYSRKVLEPNRQYWRFRNFLISQKDVRYFDGKQCLYLTFLRKWYTRRPCFPQVVYKDTTQGDADREENQLYWNKKFGSMVPT